MRRSKYTHDYNFENQGEDNDSDRYDREINDALGTVDNRYYRSTSHHLEPSKSSEKATA